MTTKSAIRAQIKELILALPQPAREEEERAISVAVRSLSEWTNAELLLTYDALPDEVSTDHLTQDAWHSAKRVFLPRIAGSTLEFLPHGGAGGEALVRHPLGMREPIRGGQWTARAGATIVLIPGRAFARDGSRLGRGGGYYDRFLSSLDRHVRDDLLLVGLSYRAQMLDELPVEGHDVGMDLIVCGGEIIRP